MKRRLDFVSNSSSSSYIIISHTKGELEDFSDFQNSDGYYEVPNRDHGRYQFDWQFINTNDFFGKLNFCAMQCFYSKNFDNYFNMLKRVVKNNFNLNIKMCHLTQQEYNGNVYKDLPSDCYIDHQSCATEGACMDMFKDEDTLLKFLSNSDSMIVGGNDNDSQFYD